MSPLQFGGWAPFNDRVLTVAISKTVSHNSQNCHRIVIWVFYLPKTQRFLSQVGKELLTGGESRLGAGRVSE
jgi:hypothetical protein